MASVTQIRKFNIIQYFFKKRLFQTVFSENKFSENINPLTNITKQYVFTHKIEKDIKQKYDNLKKTPDKIPFKNNPDVFGTLSSELLLEKRLAELPEEEDDVEVEEYIDGKEGKIRLKTIQYAKLIKNLLEQKKVREALDVLDVRMKKENAYPDDYIYRLLIAGCAKVGYTKKAFQLFNQMKKRALIVKGGVYTSLFDACANSPWPDDGIKRAEDLWNLIIEKRIELNQQITHAAIKAFGRCGAIEKAFSIVDEMSLKRIAITSETFNFLLQACITDRETGFRHALIVWRKMLDRKIYPNIYSYNLLLRCTRDCSVGDSDLFIKDLSKLLPPSQQKLLKPGIPVDNEIEINNEIITIETHQQNEKDVEKKNSLVPTLITQNPHLGSVIHIGKIVKPWHRLMLLGGRQGFIETMTKTGAKPDIKTFTVLLHTIGPNIEEEEKLIAEMKQLGIKMDIDFCNMLIKKRSLNNNFTSAKEVLSIIKEERLIPNIVTFGVLALSSSNIKNIKMLLKDIKSVGFRLNIQILGAFLKSTCHSWDFKAIEFIVKQLIKNEIKPDYKFIQTLDIFNNEIQKQITKKNEGSDHNKYLDTNNFEKEYRDFEQLIIYIKSMEIEDPANVHPWDQFKHKDSIE